MEKSDELVKQLFKMEDADWLYHLYDKIKIKDPDSEIYKQHQIFYNFVQQPELYIPLGLEYILNLFAIIEEENKERVLSLLTHYISQVKEIYAQFPSNFNIEFMNHYALLYEFFIFIPSYIVHYVEENPALKYLKEYQDAIHFTYDESLAFQDIELIKDALIGAPYYLITYYLNVKKEQQTKKAYELLKKEFFGKQMQYEDLFIETSFHFILEEENIFAYDCLSFLTGSLSTLSSHYEVSYYYLLLYLYSKDSSPLKDEKKKQKTIQKMQYLFSVLDQSNFIINEEDYPRLFYFLNHDPLFVIRPNINLEDYPHLLKKNVQIYRLHFRER